MKRPSTLALGIAAGAAAVVTAAGAPVTSSAQPTTATRTITFQEPRPRLAFDDIPPTSKSKSTLSLGDRLAIAGPLENDKHQRVGTIGGSCTVIGAAGDFGTTPLVCEAVYSTAAGQIEAMGMMTLSRTHLVIVGGSGAYAGVHGFIGPGKIEQGFSDADKLTIES